MDDETILRLIKKYLRIWKVSYTTCSDKGDCWIPVSGDCDVELDGQTHTLSIIHVKDKKGNPTYTKFKIDGHPKIRDLHPYIYRIKIGMVPKKDGKKQVIRHICNNKQCGNWDHYKAGTYAENSNDAVADGLIKSKLTPEQRAKVNERLDNGESPNRIATDYPVSRQAIYRMRDKRNGVTKSTSDSGGGSSNRDNQVAYADMPRIADDYEYIRGKGLGVRETLFELNKDENVNRGIRGIRTVVRKGAERNIKRHGKDQQWIIDEMNESRRARDDFTKEVRSEERVGLAPVALTSGTTSIYNRKEIL